VIDHDLDFLHRLGPRETKEGFVVPPNYSIPIPSHKHQWRRWEEYLDITNTQFGIKERRCFYSWKYKGRWYSCYATYVYIEKLSSWSYCTSESAVIMMNKFPERYTAGER